MTFSEEKNGSTLWNVWDNLGFFFSFHFKKIYFLLSNRGSFCFAGELIMSSQSFIKHLDRNGLEWRWVVILIKCIAIHIILLWLSVLACGVCCPQTHIYSTHTSAVLHMNLKRSRCLKAWMTAADHCRTDNVDIGRSMVGLSTKIYRNILGN